MTNDVSQVVVHEPWAWKRNTINSTSQIKRSFKKKKFKKQLYENDLWSYKNGKSMIPH